MSDFLIEFMFQLSTSNDIPENEQLLMAIISTKASCMDFDGADNSKRISEFSTLQTRISRTHLSQQSIYCVLLCIYERMTDCWNFKVCLTGEDKNSYNAFANPNLMSSEWKAIVNVLTILKSGDPYHGSDERTKQILMWAAFFVSTIMPSNRTNLEVNRLRFLTFLVNCNLDKFFNKVSFKINLLLIFLIFRKLH